MIEPKFISFKNHLIEIQSGFDGFSFTIKNIDGKVVATSFQTYELPDDAEITEIPLDVDNQVAILFVVPNDDKYYCLYAGRWNNNTESMFCSRDSESYLISKFLR